MRHHFAHNTPCSHLSPFLAALRFLPPASYFQYSPLEGLRLFAPLRVCLFGTWGWWPSGTPSLLSRVGGLTAPTEVSILTTLVVSKRFYSVQLERNKPSLIILWRGVSPRLWFSVSIRAHVLNIDRTTFTVLMVLASRKAWLVSGAERARVSDCQGYRDFIK